MMIIFSIALPLETNKQNMHFIMWGAKISSGYHLVRNIFVSYLIMMPVVKKSKWLSRHEVEKCGWVGVKKEFLVSFKKVTSCKTSCNSWCIRFTHCDIQTKGCN